MLNDGDKVYVCGKISGLSEKQYRDNFAVACNFVEQWGFVAINPLNVMPDCDGECVSGLTFDNGSYQHHWRCYMKADIIALMNCKAIFAQTDAVQSTGALLELQIARALGLPVMTYTYDRTVPDGI